MQGKEKVTIAAEGQPISSLVFTNRNKEYVVGGKYLRYHYFKENGISTTVLIKFDVNILNAKRCSDGELQVTVKYKKRKRGRTLNGGFKAFSEIPKAIESIVDFFREEGFSDVSILRVRDIKNEMVKELGICSSYSVAVSKTIDIEYSPQSFWNMVSDKNPWTSCYNRLTNPEPVEYLINREDTIVFSARVGDMMSFRQVALISENGFELMESYPKVGELSHPLTEKIVEYLSGFYSQPLQHKVETKSFNQGFITGSYFY